MTQFYHTCDVSNTADNLLNVFFLTINLLKRLMLKKDCQARLWLVQHAQTHILSILMMISIQYMDTLFADIIS